MDWSALNCIPHGVLVFTPLGDASEVFVDWSNQKASLMLGPLQGRPLRDLVPDRVYSAALLTLSTQKPRAIHGSEFQGPHPFRGDVHLCLQDEQLVLTIYDVEQILLERDLYAERYRAMVKSLPDTVHLLDKDGRFLDSHVGDLPPYKPAHEYIGRLVNDVFPPQVADALMDLIKKALSTGRVQEWEYTLPEFQSTFYFEARVFNVHVTLAGNTEVMLVIRDITQRRQAEDNLREMWENFRAAFEESLAGQVQLNPDGTFRRVNMAFAHMLGYEDPLDLMGRSVISVTHPEDVGQAQSILRATFRVGASQRVIQRYLHRDGHVIWGELSSQPIRVNGEILYSTTTILDVTAQHERNAHLQDLVNDQTRELVAANEMLQQFAYTASHDLREPLNKVISFGDRLAKKYSDLLDESGKQYLDIMRSAATRMRTLVDDILMYARSNKEESPPTLCDLDQIATEAISDLEVQILDAQAEVEVLPLPQITGHPRRLHQLFQNLISNAVKFRRPGEPCRVRVWSESTPTMAIIKVQDNGIGFDPSFKEKIFQAFTRLHTRFEYPGTGIGLAMCARIVTTHGGTIDAEGRPGEGATFTVKVPVHGGVGV